MIKIKMLALTLLASSLAINVSAKKVAITVDDLPVVWDIKYSIEKQEEIFYNALAALKKHGVQMVGFTIGNAIQDHHKVFLDQMIAEGHLIANHSATHPDFNETTPEDYWSNILKAERTISEWWVDSGDTNKYFRYPYLHRGDTVEKRDEVAEKLADSGYKIAPVSLLSRDWAYSSDYYNAWEKKDPEGMVKVGKAYLQHIKDITKRDTKLAKEKFGRDINHILLLHMNLINGDYLDDVLTWYKENGWEFITLEEALQDPVYDLEEEYVGPYGISWQNRVFLEEPTN